MNWARETAEKIIRERPNEEVYTVASGISPSGFVHIGNFREVATPYFVARELKNLGKKVRFILSIDNYDRFRKVPGGIPAEYSKYIGLPYVDMPSPFTENETYAAYFEKRFLDEFRTMGIEFECIYQADEYRKGRYAKQIKYAMDNKDKVFDIIDSFRTQDATAEEKENFYPISVYCKTCGKDDTTITIYDKITGDFAYTCTCGNSVKDNILAARNVKLQWKVDWPMRWQVENVTYETGGMDHSSLNGSHDVAERISREIFGFEPPIYDAYNFIGIKGGGAKMSSSKGNVLTITDLLKVYDKHLILWFYAKYRPMQAFNLSLDNDVIRYYSEFDRWVKQYFSGTIDDFNKELLGLTNVTEEYLNYPSFNYLATFLPMVNYDEKLLKVLLEKENIDGTTEYFAERLERAKFWTENYGTDYQVKPLEEKNVEFYNSLSNLEKSWIAKTITLLNKEYSSVEDLQSDLYAVVKPNVKDEAELKKTQKGFFESLYKLILGDIKGPKLGLLLMALKKDKLINLLTF